MDERLKIILKKIEELNLALRQEQTRLAKKYGFSISNRHITFLRNIKEKNRHFRIPAWKYIIPTNIRHILSMPFIYMMIVPSVILDIFITIYQAAAFPLYRIPKVKRSDYIVYDRRFLDYLNIIQKIHCLYCSYINGLYQYSVEIAARTERYWCPIKSAAKDAPNHSWYKHYADYGDPEEWDKRFNDHKAFEACFNSTKKKKN